MLTLTGPPRVGSLVMPLPSIEAPVRLRWDASESIYRRYQSGRVELVERRVRARLTMGWRSLPYETLVQLLLELQVYPITVTPRTAAPGDPDLDEEPLAMRLVSPMPRLDALYLHGVDVELEFEGVEVVAMVPGLDAEGGYYVVGEDDGSPILGAWGRATVEVVGDDVVLGDALMVALRTTTDAGGYRVITLTDPPD